MFGFWKSGTDGKQDNVDNAAAPNDAAAAQPSEGVFSCHLTVLNQAHIHVSKRRRAKVC